MRILLSLAAVVLCGAVVIVDAAAEAAAQANAKPVAAKAAPGP